MSRMYTQLDEDYDSVANGASPTILTMRGAPQFYYGTEILMNSPVERNDGLIRSDFPGGWKGDRVNAMTGAGLTARQADVQNFTRRLLNWRKDKTAVHGGRLKHFSPERGIYVYFRYDDDGTVMVAFNKSREPVDLDTARFSEVLGDASRGIDAVTGNEHRVGGSLALAPRSVLVLDIVD